jgi:hypothetical protein
MSADVPAVANGGLEAICKEELWQACCAIRSRFGRIVAIASLRKSPKQELLARYDADVLEKSLAHLHLRAFSDWLSLNLRQQTADMNLFEANVGSEGIPGPGAVLDLQEIEPPEAMAQEVRLFEIDFALANELLFAGRAFESTAGRSRDRALPWKLHPFLPA